MATPLQKRKLMGEINVVPYIDVMLVLLVIFMVTAPLLTQGIEVELPKAGAEPIDSAADKLPLILSVDEAGNLYLSVGDNEDEPVEAQRVVASVRAVLKNSPETPILVKADRSVQSFMSAPLRLRGAPFGHINAFSMNSGRLFTEGQRKGYADSSALAGGRPVGGCRDRPVLLGRAHGQVARDSG